MQKPPCEPSGEISVCVNCHDEDESEEGTERPGNTGYAAEDSNSSEENVPEGYNHFQDDSF